MTINQIKEAISEAERFLKRAKAVLAFQKKMNCESDNCYSPSVESAECKRASLDLTRSLARMRKLKS